MESTELSGRRVGRYVLVEEIGTGGMAAVYYGRMAGPVGFSRTVAIKRLRAPFANDPEFVSMFSDEARLAARVRHPNVVPTLDVVAMDDELLLVMEYVEGESLSQIFRAARKRAERIPIPIVLAILVAVLEGLHAAHEATDDLGRRLDIVHRDVSPQNILVGLDGIARVIDFGIAKAAHRSHHTQTGVARGKLSYMAPEQLTAQRDLGPAVDTYAAGIVLWEALVGKSLFAPEGEPILDVASRRPAPPSSLVPDVPPELDAVALKALALNPSFRFKSAHEMAVALTNCGQLANQTEVAAFVEALVGEQVHKRMSRLKTADAELSSAPSNATTQVEIEPAVLEGVKRPLAEAAPSRFARRATIAGGAIAVASAVVFVTLRSRPPAPLPVEDAIARAQLASTPDPAPSTRAAPEEQPSALPVAAPAPPTSQVAPARKPARAPTRSAPSTSKPTKPTSRTAKDGEFFERD